MLIGFLVRAECVRTLSHLACALSCSARSMSRRAVPLGAADASGAISLCLRRESRNALYDVFLLSSRHAVAIDVVGAERALDYGLEILPSPERQWSARVCARVPFHKLSCPTTAETRRPKLTNRSKHGKLGVRALHVCSSPATRLPLDNDPT